VKILKSKHEDINKQNEELNKIKNELEKKVLKIESDNILLKTKLPDGIQLDQ
jgi:hypothetical protein